MLVIAMLQDIRRLRILKRTNRYTIHAIKMFNWT